MIRLPLIFFTLFLFLLGESVLAAKLGIPTSRKDFEKIAKLEHDSGRPPRTVDAWMALKESHNIRTLQDDGTPVGWAVTRDRGSHLEIVDFWTNPGIRTRDRNKLFESALQGTTLGAPRVIAFLANDDTKEFLAQRGAYTHEAHRQFVETLESSYTVRPAADRDMVDIWLDYVPDDHAHAVLALATKGIAPFLDIKVLVRNADNSLAGVFVEEVREEEVRIHHIAAHNDTPPLYARMLSDIRNRHTKVTHRLVDQETHQIFFKLRVHHSDEYWKTKDLALVNVVYGKDGFIRKQFVNSLNNHVGHMDYDRSRGLIELKELTTTSSIDLAARELATLQLWYEHFLSRGNKGISVTYDVSPELHLHFRNFGILPNGIMLEEVVENTDVVKPVSANLYSFASLYDFLDLAPGSTTFPQDAARERRKAIRRASLRLIQHESPAKRLMPNDYDEQASILGLRHPADRELTKKEILEAKEMRLKEVAWAEAVLSDEHAKAAYDNHLYTELPRTKEGKLVLGEHEQKCLDRFREISRRLGAAE